MKLRDCNVSTVISMRAGAVRAAEGQPERRAEGKDVPHGRPPQVKCRSAARPCAGGSPTFLEPAPGLPS